MSIIAIPFVFSPGSTIVSSQVNSCNSVIYNDYNGNVGNSNLSSSLVITDSKLAQIASASKVSGTALTGLASVPSGAGVIPVANIPVGTSVGNVVQLTSVNSGAFVPTSVIGQLLGTWASGSSAIGSPQQATTDLFVTWAHNGTGSGEFRTDSSNPPTTLRGSLNSNGGSFSCLVKKNDWYEIFIVSGTTNETVSKLPVGS